MELFLQINDLILFTNRWNNTDEEMEAMIEFLSLTRVSLPIEVVTCMQPLLNLTL